MTAEAIVDVPGGWYKVRQAGQPAINIQGARVVTTFDDRVVRWQSRGTDTVRLRLPEVSNWPMSEHTGAFVGISRYAARRDTVPLVHTGLATAAHMSCLSPETLSLTTE
jgi:hypothetical protein